MIKMSEVGKIEIFCHKCDHRMNKKISMPSLIGFDDIGRSGRKNDKDSKEISSKESSKKETKTEAGAKKEKKTEPSPKKEKAA